jgi:Tfp pilus assembly protein PilX
MRIIMPNARNESGVAVIIALAVMAILLALTGVVLTATANLSDDSNRDTITKRAFEAAQAGLQATVYRMNMRINSESKPPSELAKYCVGGPEEAVLPPSLGPSKNICASYSESLGNGASYRSWTTTVFSGVGTCAGVQVGTTNTVAERCVTSEGIVTRGARTVTHRVQERVVAFSSRPVFPVGGVIGENGVQLANQATIEGPVYTNGQLEAKNQASSHAYGLGKHASPPIVEKPNASIGEKLPEVEPWPTYAPIPPEQAWPEGDQRIENAFLTCAQIEAKGEQCAAKDEFKGCASASACGWEPASRTLNIKGDNWILGGKTYTFCGLTIESGAATLAAKLKTVIYIDSPSDPQSKCPAGTGYFQMKSKGEFINLSQPLEGSPLLHDTTALVVFIFGPSDIEPDTIYSNACTSGHTDSTCVSIGGQGEFYGTVYAPQSDVKVSNPGKNAGAIEGRTVTYENKGSFKQDTNVTTLLTTTSLGTFHPAAWHECGSPTEPPADPMSGC